MAADKPGGGGCGVAERVEEEENGNDGGKRRTRAGERELWPRPSWVTVEHARAVLLPPSSFLSISFSRLVKNFTKRNFIFPSHPTPVFARHGAAELPHPGSNGNTYVPITFSFCL